jgi:DNA-directed RNA polymerase specialized sigma24 family protein
METSASLLERLRTCPDEAAWQRLDDLYQPLIRRWLLRDPSLREDADDLVQEVMSVLVRELPRFRRRRNGSFRRWRRNITAHRVQEVMSVLVRELPRFRRRRNGSFRRWLRVVAPHGTDCTHV